MKLTFVAIVLALGLVGVTVWQAMEARKESTGRPRNSIEQMQQQGNGGTNSDALKQMENKILVDHISTTSKTPPPIAPPLNTKPLLPPKAGPKIDPAHVGPAAMEATPPPLSQRQRLILSVPALAKITDYQKDYGFVVITAGASQKLEKGMTFAIRRGPAIIGRINVTQVENNSAVADLDSRSVPAGVTIENGDDIIQYLPPEA